MQKQEIFDKMVKHLLTQNARSLEKPKEFEDEPGCAYRGTNGTMCAVGCLIKDEHYSKALEGYNVSVYEVNRALQNSGVVFDSFGDIENMLYDVQQIHDRCDVKNWRTKLMQTAEKHNLQFNG